VATYHTLGKSVKVPLNLYLRFVQAVCWCAGHWKLCAWCRGAGSILLFLWRTLMAALKIGVAKGCLVTSYLGLVWPAAHRLQCPWAGVVLTWRGHIILLPHQFWHCRQSLPHQTQNASALLCQNLIQNFCWPNRSSKLKVTLQFLSLTCIIMSFCYNCFI